MAKRRRGRDNNVNLVAEFATSDQNAGMHPGVQTKLNNPFSVLQSCRPNVDNFHRNRWTTSRSSFQSSMGASIQMNLSIGQTFFERVFTVVMFLWNWCLCALKEMLLLGWEQLQVSRHRRDKGKIRDEEKRKTLKERFLPVNYMQISYKKHSQPQAI